MRPFDHLREHLRRHVSVPRAFTSLSTFIQVPHSSTICPEYLLYMLFMFCLQVEMYIDDEPSSPCRGRCCPWSPPSMLHLGIPHPLPATLPRPSLPFLLYSRDTYLLYLHLLFPCLISSHTTFKHENFKTDAISHYCTLQTISLVAEGGFIALLMECGHFLPVHLWHLLACAPLASL